MFRFHLHFSTITSELLTVLKMMNIDNSKIQNKPNKELERARRRHRNQGSID